MIGKNIFGYFLNFLPYKKPDAILPAQNPSLLSAKFSLNTKKPGNFALRDIFCIGRKLRNVKYFLNWECTSKHNILLNNLSSRLVLN